MSKVFMMSAVILTLFLAESAFAKKVCLQDSFGGFWELKGGKVDKKSYTVKIIPSSLSCVTGGIADVTLTDSGSFVMGVLSSHDTAGNCLPVLWSATVDETFSGSGNWDRLGDGSIEGTFTLAPIKCSAMPQSLSDNPKTGNANHPVINKQ